MFPQRAFIAAILVLLPLAASAKETVLWDFRGSKIPGQWSVEGQATADKTAQGLHVKTTTDTVMRRDTFFIHGIDAMSITVASAQDKEIVFAWHPRDFIENDFVQLPLSLAGGGLPGKLEINLGKYPQWDPMADAIALALPAGTDIVLQELAFHRYTFAEKLAEGWRSFWTFDAFTRYSINFLWGPLIVTTPDARAELYSMLPPNGWSANRIFYAVLAFGGLCAALLWAFLGWSSRRALLLAGVILAACWVFYDMRMSAEIVAYAREDWQTYVRAEHPSLRGSLDLYEVLDHAAPLLATTERYGLVLPGNFPLYSFFRYFTYPSVPVPEGDARKNPDISTWLVFKRAGMHALPGGLYLPGGAQIAGTGTLLLEMPDNTLLYRQTP